VNAAVPVPAAAALPAALGRWLEAATAAALFAVDPCGIGGVVLRGGPGPLRDAWLEGLRALLGPEAPWRRVPVQVAEGRLLGGLDLAATLAAGRPLAERGLLAAADGGVAVLAMAERLPTATAALVCAALDRGEVVVERDGVQLRHAARFGVVALDEAVSEDEVIPPALLDRLALRIDLGGLRLAEPPDLGLDAAAIAAARGRLPRIVAGDSAVEALCAASVAFGIDSLRAAQLALRVARAAAALAGRARVADDDVTLAARLVLGPRATQLPASPEEPAPPEDEPPPPPPPPPDAPDASRDDAESRAEQPLEDRVLEAVSAALPADLLALLAAGQPPRGGARSSGRSGAAQRGDARGRPAGVRRGELRPGARLSVIETLRAAAPWQPLRRRERARGSIPGVPASTTTRRLEVRRDDFRIARHRQRTRTTTIFVVDASGSQALNRLGEAKGAVELLLAECYVRRDQVALLAFRGRGAELLLPPTRSLVRARRSLAQLPGGGGTPLASGIDAAATLAVAARRRGESPLVILLTDGRANVARDGAPGRPLAEQHALEAARAFRAEGLAAMLIDTSPRPQEIAARVAQQLGARYLPLPHADAAMLSRAVRSALPSDAVRA
jgi:magnesium chelatase subunit D